ncbi:MAG: magnesium transporter [Nitrosomonadaceae bacterium]|nr:magnesium transporter [Nitrosomonadaceae bacterium]|tara:strand:+ start:1150 stop:2595 length:1446 start_codon:yes stop_codon:yes gene_type:complete
MTRTTNHNDNETDNPEQHLQRVVYLLSRNKLVAGFVQMQDERKELDESLVHEKNFTELQELLDMLHPADIAYILEALPLDERLIVWEMAKLEQDGEILLETSDAVRETLIATMNSNELVAATGQLDADEIADLAPDLPSHVLDDLFQKLPIAERERLRAAMSYPEDSVGALMDFDMVTVRKDVKLEVVLRYLRRLEEMPDHTDQLFIIDRNEKLIGVLPVNLLLINDPDIEVSKVMSKKMMKFHANDKAQQATHAFERYNLVTAPVVDIDNKLLGRVTVNEVMDFIREESENEALNLAGLREEEDLFAPVWKSIKNRWVWLAINLITAFIASRVIGVFEGSIEKLVALAALMPIIASIGGNSGNQTITMIVRALALGQLNTNNTKKLFAKEIGVSSVNGFVCGSIVGLFSFIIYENASLSLVMTMAMTLTFLLAAILGVFVPLTLQKLGRDPATGSNIVVTAILDSGGFFIFLGLATILLI